MPAPAALVRETASLLLAFTFWASWCAACRPEMLVLEGFHRELAPRGLTIIGINAW